MLCLKKLAAGSPESCFWAALEFWEDVCLIKRDAMTPHGADKPEPFYWLTLLFHQLWKSRCRRSQMSDFSEVSEGFITPRCDCMHICDLLLGCITMYFCSNLVHMETFQVKEEEEKEKEELEDEKKEAAAAASFCHEMSVLPAVRLLAWLLSGQRLRST